MKLSKKLSILNRHLKKAPIDVIGISNSLNIDCYEASLEKNLSGMLEKLSDEKYRIIYNDRHPSTRQRFTIAHELAHYFLHSSLIDKGIEDNYAYRSVVGGKYQNSSIGPLEETDANKFAAYILMPNELMEEMKSNEPGILIKDAAERFNVSRAAMEIRYKQFDIS